MANFVEVQLPTNISKGAVGGPEFLTTIIELGSGHEQRDIRWSKARARYNIAYAIRSTSDLNTVRSFFFARQGRAYGFRFKDWADYELSDGSLGTGDGETTEFQLVKEYTSGSVTYTRTITKPVAGSVKIYVDSVEATDGWSVDTTTGIVTFDAAPATDTEITADCEFDVPVRFDTDWLPQKVQEITYGGIDDVPLVEIKI